MLMVMSDFNMEFLHFLSFHRGFYTKPIPCFSLFNKHLTQQWRLVHKLQGTSLGVHHQNGYTCRLVAALKERRSFYNLCQLLIMALREHASSFNDSQENIPFIFNQREAFDSFLHRANGTVLTISS